MTPTPRVLGVDDVALQKGRIDGTILVDHERGVPIDLVPDRTSAPMATWLHNHPGVEIMTRDRSTAFTRGATDGAPHAIQVADRWHVLTNLREAVERMLQRRMPDRTRLLTPAGAATTPSTARPLFPHHTSAQARNARQARREERVQRFQTIQELTKRGMNILHIADYLQVSRQTVRRYRAATEAPEPAPPRPAPSHLAPYVRV